jgi:hypothetical protein
VPSVNRVFFGARKYVYHWGWASMGISPGFSSPYILGCDLLLLSCFLSSFPSFCVVGVLWSAVGLEFGAMI